MMAFEIFLLVIKPNIVVSIHNCDVDGRRKDLFALISVPLSQLNHRSTDDTTYSTQDSSRVSGSI